MSFEKKLFKINLKVAFIPMIAFLIFVLTILGIYRHLFFSGLSDTNFSQDGSNQVIQLMMQTEPSELSIETFDTKAYIDSYTDYGYQVAVLMDNAYQLSDLSHQEEENLAAYVIRNFSQISDVPTITTYNRYRYIVIHKINESHDYYIIAVSSSRVSASLLNDNVFFVATLLLMILLLLFIFQLCRSYSKRLVRQLMLPIVLLGDGAKRIQEGNLEVQLDYSSNDEFQPVFDSFNEMQTRLKGSILQQLERESKQQEMIAEISHDLKTPLTSIKGYVKGIEDGVANTAEKQQHYLEKIRKKTDDMTHMIDEILLYSKLERNKVKFESVPVELNAYLKEVLSVFEEDFKDDSLKLDFSPDTSLAHVSLDPLQFNRVLENIIENSRKYSGKSQILMKIATSVGLHEVVITIKDNGVGIAEEKLPFIFDTFYRVDDARNQATNGSGLGLSITKHIIQQMSGNITAHNDNGLCLTIILPLIKENSDATNTNN